MFGRGGDVLGQVQKSGQIPPGVGLAGQRGRQEVLVSGELGFGLKHLQLGGYTSLVTGPGIPQADQRGLNGGLTNPDVVIAVLELEVGLRGLQAQVAQSNQIGVLRLLKRITGRADLGNPLGINQIPIEAESGRCRPTIGLSFSGFSG